jgi:hypothetical protein
VAFYGRMGGVMPLPDEILHALQAGVEAEAKAKVEAEAEA